MPRATPTGPYVQEFPCLPSLGEHCGNCHRCTDPPGYVAGDGTGVALPEYDPENPGPHDCHGTSAPEVVPT